MIYGLIETDFLKKAINYDYTWINERDLLVNLRTFGNFRYLKENLFTKTKENSDSSLQNDKFFSSRLSDRGNSKWLKSMLKTTKNTKFLLLMLLLFLPIFFKRMLKSFKYV